MRTTTRSLAVSSRRWCRLRIDSGARDNSGTNTLDSLTPLTVLSSLVVVSFFYFRFALIDPQYPKRPKFWSVVVRSLGASLLCFFAFNGGAISSLFAAIAVSMITSPAIAPSINISKEEAPNLVLRLWKGQKLGFGNTLWKSSVLAFGFWLFSAKQTVILGEKFPAWYLIFGVLGGFLLISRPISRPIHGSEVDRTQVPSNMIDMSPGVTKLRFLSVFCYILWLSLSLPLLEEAFSPDQGVFQLAVAAALGGFATQNT